jgi:putative ABC transport system ATP-binding protein
MRAPVPNTSTRPEPEQPVLELRQLRHRWPGEDSDVLNIPSLRLQAGQRLLVRGASGSGKSTLLSLVAGVMQPLAGEVCLQGQDWRALPARQRDRLRAQSIGYIFQQFNLLPYLSALDNVCLPCRLSAHRAQRAGDVRAAAQALLAGLDLAPALWQQRASQLSVGQQQRVAAARALIGQPALVLADEPTSALDETRRDAFMQVLLAQCAVAGSALLFVTHDARLAQHFDQVLDLDAPVVPAGLAETPVGVLP